jgi:predicted HicB family RNase H-like nuclease
MRPRQAQLTHKGYTGTVNFSPEDKVFWGKLDGIRATVSYEGDDAESLLKSFREAVEDYLDMCKREHIEPEKPYKGIFNVRMSTDLHRELALYAQAENMNLNSAVKQAIEHFLHGKTPFPR